MSALGRPGTIVRVPDGRIGTVVFNGHLLHDSACQTANQSRILPRILASRA